MAIEVKLNLASKFIELGRNIVQNPKCHLLIPRLSSIHYKWAFLINEESCLEVQILELVIFIGPS